MAGVIQERKGWRFYRSHVRVRLCGGATLPQYIRPHNRKGYHTRPTLTLPYHNPGPRNQTRPYCTLYVATLTERSLSEDHPLRNLSAKAKKLKKKTFSNFLELCFLKRIVFLNFLLMSHSVVYKCFFCMVNYDLWFLSSAHQNSFFTLICGEQDGSSNCNFLEVWTRWWRHKSAGQGGKVLRKNLGISRKPFCRCCPRCCLTREWV